MRNNVTQSVNSALERSLSHRGKKSASKSGVKAKTQVHLKYDTESEGALTLANADTFSRYDPPMQQAVGNEVLDWDTRAVMPKTINEKELSDH